MDFSKIIEKEKEVLKRFFNQDFSFSPPEISQEKFTKLNQFGFDLHFLPAIKMSEEKEYPGWQEKPFPIFYQLIKKEKIPENSDFLFGQWVFIEKKEKPKKDFPWITKDDILVKVLKKFRFDFKKYYQKVKSKSKEDDFLTPILKENGFFSRFSLSWQEINELILPSVARFLNLPLEKIRLPRFIEWNFLANAFYPEWKKTETWEWFNDRLSTGECLSGGANSLGILGWDPPDYWSTILGFRILIEV